MDFLLLCDFKIAFAVVVIPTAGHHVFLDLSINHVVNGLTASAFGIGLHVYGARLWIERILLQRNRPAYVGATRHVSA